MNYDFQVLVPMFASSKINSDYDKRSGIILDQGVPLIAEY